MFAGKVETADIFQFELAFAMTVHKAQGRTLPKVILALSNRANGRNQMSYASICVAMSRVEHQSDLKLLLHTERREDELRYVTTLQHNTSVLDYFEGFDTVGNGVWDKDKSLRAKARRLAKK